MIGFGLNADTASQPDPSKAAYIGLACNSTPTAGDSLVSQNAKLEISSPGGIYFPKNVGIGTDDPSERLTVAGNTKIVGGGNLFIRALPSPIWWK